MAVLSVGLVAPDCSMQNGQNGRRTEERTDSRLEII
jgi:hypothetical protein